MSLPEPAMRAADQEHGWRIYYAARHIAGANRVFPRPGVLSVPPHWTAWLLMDKAGMPRDLIVQCSRVERQEIDRKISFARWLMMSPVYAAKVEALMHEMPLFSGEHSLARGASAPLVGPLGRGPRSPQSEPEIGATGAHRIDGQEPGRMPRRTEQGEVY